MNGSWRYDEFNPVGRDYGAPDEVAVYDASHADFRDMEAESQALLDTLGLRPGDGVIDFGCGTGTFALAAAKRGLRVHAVDVSQAMLARAKSKAEGVAGIEFHHAGFLSYQHKGDLADAVVTTFAFHHLPDFWKGIALKRTHAMLKDGGQFYMHDVILEERCALENIARFIEAQKEAGGDFLKEDAEGHFRDEFSTYDWIIDELLARAGFRITVKSLQSGVLGTYLCKK